MQITLDETEIKQAVREYVRTQGLTGTVADIDFSMGRNPPALSASIMLGLQSPAAATPPAEPVSEPAATPPKATAKDKATSSPRPKAKNVPAAETPVEPIETSEPVSADADEAAEVAEVMGSDTTPAKANNAPVSIGSANKSKARKLFQ